MYNTIKLRSGHTVTIDNPGEPQPVRVHWLKGVHQLDWSDYGTRPYWISELRRYERAAEFSRIASICPQCFHTELADRGQLRDLCEMNENKPVAVEFHCSECNYPQTALLVAHGLSFLPEINNEVIDELIGDDDGDEDE